MDCVGGEFGQHPCGSIGRDWPGTGRGGSYAGDSGNRTCFRRGQSRITIHHRRTALGKKHDLPDLARELIDGGKSLAEAREAILDKLETRTMAAPIQPANRTDNDLGLSDKEVRQFSFVRALNYLCNIGDAKAREAAAFEIEVGEAAAKRYERSSNGIVVPNEILRRDLTVGTPAATWWRMSCWPAASSSCCVTGWR